MRIAYILPSLQNPSGWRTHAVAFLRAVSEQVEPVLFVAQGEVEEARRLFPQAPVYAFAATQSAWPGSRRGWTPLLATRRGIRSGRYPVVDLVHSLEAYPTGLVGSWLARRLGCRHVITAHGTYGIAPAARPLDRWLYGRVLRSAALVCPISHGTAERMQQVFGAALARTPVRPILNGNDFYRSVSSKEALERRPPPIPTLLSVGDVKPRKGQHISLAAFVRVKERLPQARYFIAGSYTENRYYQELQALIAERQLQDVHFLGRIPEEALRAQYRQASVFILTPQVEGLHFEGFGLVYLEAGAYGLPVVGTRTGGVPDAVKDGATGLLVEPGDVDGTAQAVLRLLMEPELACAFGRANRRRAEVLTWERCAVEYKKAYRLLLGAR